MVGVKAPLINGQSNNSNWSALGEQASEATNKAIAKYRASVLKEDTSKSTIKNETLESDKASTENKEEAKAKENGNLTFPLNNKKTDDYFNVDFSMGATKNDFGLLSFNPTINLPKAYSSTVETKVLKTEDLTSSAISKSISDSKKESKEKAASLIVETRQSQVSAKEKYDAQVKELKEKHDAELKIAEKNTPLSLAADFEAKETELTTKQNNEVLKFLTKRNAISSSDLTDKDKEKLNDLLEEQKTELKKFRDECQVQADKATEDEKARLSRVLKKELDALEKDYNTEMSGYENTIKSSQKVIDATLTKEEARTAAALLKLDYEEYKANLSEGEKSMSFDKFVKSNDVDNNETKKNKNKIISAYYSAMFAESFQAGIEEAKSFNKNYEEITSGMNVDVSDFNGNFKKDFAIVENDYSNSLAKMRSNGGWEKWDKESDVWGIGFASKWWTSTFNGDTGKAWKDAAKSLAFESAGLANDAAKDLIKSVTLGTLKFNTWSDFGKGDTWADFGKSAGKAILSKIFGGGGSVSSAPIETDVVGNATNNSDTQVVNGNRIFKDSKSLFPKAEGIFEYTANSIDYKLGETVEDYTSSKNAFLKAGLDDENPITVSQVKKKGKRVELNIKSGLQKRQKENLISSTDSINKKNVGMYDETEKRLQRVMNTTSILVKDKDNTRLIAENEVFWATEFFNKKIQNLSKVEDGKQDGKQKLNPYEKNIIKTQIHNIITNLDLQTGYYLAYFENNGVPYVENGAPLFYIDKLNFGKMNPAEQSKVSYGDSTLELRSQGNSKGDSKVSWEMREDTFTTFRNLLRSKMGLNDDNIHNGKDDKEEDAGEISEDKLNLHVVIPLDATEDNKHNVMHLTSYDLRIVKLPGLNLSQESKQLTTKVEASCRKTTMTFETI